MRKKFISRTYLRDVRKYNFTFYNEGNDDYYLSVKHILDVKDPFIITTNVCLIDNGSYIVEIIPKRENYAIRIYIDKNKKILQYYFDITLENGLDKDSLIPYYDDLYLDVIYSNNNIELIDEDELQEALDIGDITQDQYDLAYKTAKKLINELETNSNKYLKLNLDKYLN